MLVVLAHHQIDKNPVLFRFFDAHPDSYVFLKIVNLRWKNCAERFMSHNPYPATK